MKKCHLCHQERPQTSFDIAWASGYKPDSDCGYYAVKLGQLRKCIQDVPANCESRNGVGCPYYLRLKKEGKI